MISTCFVAVLFFQLITAHPLITNEQLVKECVPDKYSVCVLELMPYTYAEVACSKNTTLNNEIVDCIHKNMYPTHLPTKMFRNCCTVFANNQNDLREDDIRKCHEFSRKPMMGLSEKLCDLKRMNMGLGQCFEICLTELVNDRSFTFANHCDVSLLTNLDNMIFPPSEEKVFELMNQTNQNTLKQLLVNLNP